MNNSSMITSDNGAREAAEGSHSSVLMTNLVSGFLLAGIASTLLLTIGTLVA